jgi:hypothetical protein
MQTVKPQGVAVYDNGKTAPLTNTRDIELSVATPTDRVRWGSILAGLFTALSTGILLSLAALAFGLNQFDPTSTARSFGLGAGIVGAVIWLVAFGVGGYVAARTAAVVGRSNGIFNGLMVSLVGIPLLVWGLSSVVGGLLGTAGSVAGTAAQAIAPAAGQVAGDPAVQQQAQDAGQQAQQLQQQAQQQLQQVDPEQVADTARNTALGALLPLVLGVAAAGTGGALGVRKPEHDDVAVTA